MRNPKQSKQISGTAFRCTFNKDPRVPRMIKNDREMTATARDRRFSVFLEESGGGRWGGEEKPRDSKGRHGVLLKKMSFQVTDDREQMCSPD